MTAPWLPRWLLGIRFRIVLVSAFLVALALSVAAVAVLRLQRDALTDNLESAIRLRADDIGALVRSGQLPETLDQADSEIAAVQLVTLEGVVVASTPNLTSVGPISDERPVVDQTIMTRVDGLPIEDDPYLLLSRGVLRGDGGIYVLHVAGSIDPIDESLAALSTTLWIGIPGLVLFVAIGTWLVVGWSLAPVDAIRDEVDRITGSNLHHRVPQPAVDDEVGRLARTMNAMLERLQDATARQEQFVADAAHELRSPLASLRAQLEVAGEDGSDALLEEVVRLQHLADDLLLLARGQSARGDSQLVDLDDLLLVEVRRLRPLSSVTIDTAAVSAGQVRGQPDELQRVMRNLLDNAVRHAASRVVLTLGEQGSSVLLAVEDDGPGVSSGDADRIFERFTRLDGARGRGEGGAGLGLAIARSIARAHGGDISLDTARQTGARFVVQLPAVDAGQESLAGGTSPVPRL